MGRARGSKRAPGPNKPPLTHFLCLPLITPESKPQLERTLRSFRDAVCSGDDETSKQDQTTGEDLPWVHPKAIRPVGTLHFTIGVMSLKPAELTVATELLGSIDLGALVTEAIANSDIPTETTTSEVPEAGASAASTMPFNLKGLESMHPPQQTSILYAAPQKDSGVLYPFCVALQKAFKDKGLLVEDDRKLKLHATIVNTIYAKGRKPAPQTRNASSSTAPHTSEDRSQSHGPKANAPLKIDARSLVDAYRDHIWANDIVLNRIAICEMGAKKVLDPAGNVIEERYNEIATRALI